MSLGNPQNFFNGNRQGEHKCACGETNSCLSDGGTDFECNCDAKMPVWTADAGIITAKDILPITGVFYGPLIFDLERANFSIGSLKCKGTTSNLLCIYTLLHRAFKIFRDILLAKVMASSDLWLGFRALS